MLIMSPDVKNEIAKHKWTMFDFLNCANKSILSLYFSCANVFQHQSIACEYKQIVLNNIDKYGEFQKCCKLSILIILSLKRSIFTSNKEIFQQFCLFFFLFLKYFQEDQHV